MKKSLKNIMAVVLANTIMSFLLIILCFSFKPGASEIVVKHHNYTTYYNTSNKEADSVAWDLSPAMVSCGKVDRKNPFKMDPSIPGSATPEDYAVNAGNPDRPAWIDEGHLMSYQSAMCTPFGVYECFYMSNMLPQFHAFNAGDWKTLEIQERILAKTKTIHIIAGGFGTMTNDTLKYGLQAIKRFPKGHLPNGENIPAYMWKGIVMNGTMYVYIMPNSIHSVGHSDTNFWLDPQLHKIDLMSIGNEIKRLKI